MSDYNKVIKNENGITKEEFMELFYRIANDNSIYVNVSNGDGNFTHPIKLTSAYSAFGCLYIDIPELKTIKE